MTVSGPALHGEKHPFSETAEEACGHRRNGPPPPAGCSGTAHMEISYGWGWVAVCTGHARLAQANNSGVRTRPLGPLADRLVGPDADLAARP